jgi:hypothetical protein
MKKVNQKYLKLITNDYKIENIFNPKDIFFSFNQKNLNFYDQIFDIKNKL